MKKKQFSPYRNSDILLKIKRIMRFSAFLLLTTALNVSAIGFSQVEKVTVKLANASMKEFFRVLEGQTQYKFLYRDDILENANVNMSLEDASLRDVLNLALEKNNFAYKILANNLIVVAPKERLMQISVTGTVTDATTGEPLPGVNIVIKGTGTGTISDLNGNFTLQVNDKDDILVFSFVGYKTLEVPLGGRTSLSIQMEPEVMKLDEIVVVGYGTQQKVNLTGAVSVVRSEDISQKPVTQLSSALQGMSSGVTIVQGTGQPGVDQGTIRVRGIGTVNNADPLVVIDGFEVDLTTFNNLNPHDIESISILKDAAASSIYGVRAANGVILITTKRGSAAKTRVSYSNYFGWQNPTQLPDYVSAQSYMKLVNLAQINSGGTAIFTDETIAAYSNSSRNRDLYPDVNWMKEIMQGNGFQQEHNIAITGGNEKGVYHFSTNYFEQNGLIRKTDFNRISMRLNADIEVSKKLTLSANVSGSFSDRTEPQEGMWFQFQQASVANPTLPVKYSDGTWGICRGDGNPVRLQEEGGLYEYKNRQALANVKLIYKLNDALSFTGAASTNYMSLFNSNHDIQLEYTDFFTGSSTRKGTNDVQKEIYDILSTNFQALGDYKKDFDKHAIHLLAGISRQEYSSDWLRGYRRDGSTNILNSIDAGDASTQVARGNSTSYGLLSYFGRINYSFDNRYLFEFNLRRDGSSRFAEKNRWGTFPSFAAAWRISKEAFLSDVDFLNELKIRASWGALGNHDALSNNYPYMALFDLNQNYSLGQNLVPGARVTTAVNSDISWEKTVVTNFGMDATLLGQKLDFSFDYYIKNTEDIIFQLPIPPSVGLSAPQQNAGTVRNTGWEINAGYRTTVGENLKISARLNFSDVINEVVDWKDLKSIEETSDHVARISQEGSPLWAFYGYICDGIFQSAQEVTDHAFQSGTTAPGDLKYRNVNSTDNSINGDDRVVIGSSIPRYTYGLNLSANYKNLDFSIFFQGVGKVDVMTVQTNKAPISQDGNFKSFWLDSWTSENTDAAWPRLSRYSNNYLSSSFWIKSGAYLRVKNIQLGYTLPATWTSKVGISRSRIFIGGQNLFTICGLNKYSIDPENPQDTRYYPQVKLVNFGINVDF